MKRAAVFTAGVVCVLSAAFGGALIGRTADAGRFDPPADGVVDGWDCMTFLSSDRTEWHYSCVRPAETVDVFGPNAEVRA